MCPSRRWGTSRIGFPGGIRRVPPTSRPWELLRGHDLGCQLSSSEVESISTFSWVGQDERGRELEIVALDKPDCFLFVHVRRAHHCKGSLLLKSERWRPPAAASGEVLLLLLGPGLVPASDRGHLLGAAPLSPIAQAVPVTPAQGRAITTPDSSIRASWAPH